MLGFQRKHFLLDTQSESWIFIHHKKSKADSCLHRQLHPVYFSPSVLQHVYVCPSSSKNGSLFMQQAAKAVCVCLQQKCIIQQSHCHSFRCWQERFFFFHLFIFPCESRSSEGAIIHLLLHSGMWWPFACYPSLPSHNLAGLIQIITHERAGGLASYRVM